MRYGALAAIAAVSAVIAGCGAQGDNTGQANTVTPSEENAAALEAVMAASEPEGAMSVEALKAEERADDEVAVTGRIGGRAAPFVEDRAMFIRADLGLQMCVGEGESCATPWDACCESPDEIIAKAITVQVKHTAGQVARSDLRGVGGLEPMAKVTVRGKVSEQNEQVLVLDAESIYVHPEESAT